MKKNSIKIITGFSLLLGAVLIWLSRGDSEVLFKETSPPKESDEYKGAVLWPITEEDQKISGEASGVAVNSKGDIFYLHRGSSQYGGKTVIEEPVLIVLDGKTKEVKSRWGENTFSSPHGLEIDHEDHVWITDITQNKVYKFSEDGKRLKTFGEKYPFYMETALRIRNVLPRFPAGLNEYTFARPTDLTVLNDGSFVVSDGYRNSRMVKFDPSGKFQWEVNQLGSGPGEFNLPHGISHDEQGNLYVADRNNARIQVFSRDGEFQTEWTQKELGRPFGVEVGEDGKIYVADGGDSLYPDKGKGSHQIVVLNKEGKILTRFGKWGAKTGEFKIPHDLAVDQKGNIYVAELENKRLQMFSAETSLQ